MVNFSRYVRDFTARYPTQTQPQAQTLTVVETAKLTPALIEMLNERGAMRVPVTSR
jgi:hypothetical protein